MKLIYLRYTAIILFISGVLLSCTKGNQQPLIQELSLAESIMYAHPDSALRILEEMVAPTPSEQFQYATWCLFLTQARYKNYVTQHSDSLINVAYEYFIRQDDPQRKALALYLKGALYGEWREADKALPYFLKAAEEVEKTKDYQLAHLIHLEIGVIYVYSILYNYAEDSFQKALEYAELSENKIYIASSLLHIARIYLLTTTFEESVPYYEKAIEVAKLSMDPHTISATLGELAVVYRESGNYELALQYDYEALYISKKENLPTEQDYLGIGNIYYRMGQHDSAYYYLTQALETANIYTKHSAYRALYSLAKEKKDYEKAMDYGDQYRFYADSIQKVDRSSTLIEMQEKYNQEKLINETNQLKIEKARTMRNALVGTIFLLSIIAVLIYVYQRKLLRKERTIQKNEEQIRLYTLKIHENESLISRNKSRIQELAQEMEQSQEIQEMFEDQQQAIDEIQNQNEHLQRENQKLQENISVYSASLQEKSKELKALQRLSEKNLYLQEREKFLCSQLIKKTKILHELKTSPKYLDVVRWEEVKETIDWLYEDFTKRISKDIDSLTETDMQICCLVKLRLGIPEMAVLLGISPTSVSKRKLRLKERIIQKLGNPFEQEQTLDLWLWEY